MTCTSQRTLPTYYTRRGYSTLLTIGTYWFSRFDYYYFRAAHIITSEYCVYKRQYIINNYNCVVRLYRSIVK